MDVNDINYESNCVLLNMLPKYVYFELFIDDIITAEYYIKDKDIYLSIPLSYEYLSVNSRLPEYIEDMRLQKEIDDNMINDFDTKNHYSIVLKVLIITLIILLLFIIFY